MEDAKLVIDRDVLPEVDEVTLNGDVQNMT